MTITVELTPELEFALAEEAARQGLTLEGLAAQALMRSLIAGLKDRPIPQSVEEIKPRRLPPPGKTAMEMVYQQIPADEADEVILKALEELS